MTTRIRALRPLSHHLLGAAFLALASASPLSVTLAQGSGRGVWHLHADSPDDRVQLTFDHEADGRRGGTTSFGIAREALRGLTDAQLRSASSAVRFQLVRDAGTFDFDGQLRDGEGTGFFTFAPDSRFTQQLAARGYERPTAEQQFWLALHDIGYAFVDELRADGYDRPSVQQLVVMGMHGANLEYVRSLKAAGYRVGDTHRLVTLRDHGVTPDYIAGMRSSGFTGLTPDQLLEARDHGVTDSFVRGFRELGYSNATLRDFVRMRDHGVSAGYARDVRERDGRLLSVEDLIRRRDRGER
jgi:hypothetical protein